MLESGGQANTIDGLYDVGQYNNNSSNTWQVLTNNTPEAVPNSNINFGNVQILLNNLAANTIVTIDEIKVSEYNQSNNFIRDIFLDDFSINSFYVFVDWIAGTGIQVQKSANGGYLDSSSMIIQGPTTDNAGLYLDFNMRFFPVNPNNKYQISVRVKVQNPETNTVVYPTMTYYHSDDVFTFNKSYLEAAVQRYIDYSNQYNVPVYMGEYGVGTWCFKEIKKFDGTYVVQGNWGGEQWTDDMFSIIRDNKLNSSYWLYCSSFDSFGLDLIDPVFLFDVTYINEYLENAFRDYFNQF